jgi:hypothetical protein
MPVGAGVFALRLRAVGREDWLAAGRRSREERGSAWWPEWDAAVVTMGQDWTALLRSKGSAV